MDLMVPEALAGPGSRTTRGARIPPHDRRAARRASGLEAVVVDNSVMDVTALDDADHRHYQVRVAGTAALVVAKIHKIAERVSAPHRLNDKDAHDIYRILIAVDTVELRTAFHALLRDPLSADTTRQAVTNLRDLFAVSPDALGAVMAARAEEGIGEPLTVALSSSILAADLLNSLVRVAEMG